MALSVVRELAARYTTALANRDKERGATALEYVGMLIVAAIVVGATLTVINPETIGTAVRNAVNSILNTGG